MAASEAKPEKAALRKRLHNSADALEKAVAVHMADNSQEASKDADPKKVIVKLSGEIRQILVALLREAADA